MLILTHDTANEFWHLPRERNLNVAQRRQLGEAWRLMTVGDGYVDTSYERATLRRLQVRWPQLSSPLHTVYKPGERKQTNERFVYHLQSADLGGCDLIRVWNDLLVASPELVFIQMAASLDLIPLIELGYEYCGSFFVDTTGTLRNRKLMTTPGDLLARANRYRGPGARKARLAAKYVLPGADSPREVVLVILLTLPRYWGGYNLSKPVLNHDIRLSAEGREILGFPTVAPDLCWPDAKVAVEYNGRDHFDDERSALDAKRRKALEASGYTVIEVTNSMIDSAASMDALAKRLAKLLHETPRLRVQIDDFPKKQEELRSALGLHM